MDTVPYDKAVIFHLREVSETVLVYLRGVWPEPVAVVVVFFYRILVRESVVVVAAGLFVQAPSPEVEETASFPGEFHAAFATQYLAEFALVHCADCRVLCGFLDVHPVGTGTYLVHRIQYGVVYIVLLYPGLGPHQKDVGVAYHNLRIFVCLEFPPLILGALAQAAAVV